MPKWLQHGLLPQNPWAGTGFTWCLRRVSPRLKVSPGPFGITCPVCLKNQADAASELRHPLALYAHSERLRQALRVQTPATVAACCRHLVPEPQEVVVSVLLTARKKILAVDELYRGTLDQALLHPREIFTAALRRNAHSFILVHNHPSGDPEPSEEDYVFTRQLLARSRFMDIPFLDHVIVALQGFCSLRESTAIWDET